MKKEKSKATKLVKNINDTIISQRNYFILKTSTKKILKTHAELENRQILKPALIFLAFELCFFLS